MLNLPAQKREENVKAAAVRGQGMVPAILYGPKTDSTSVTVDRKQFNSVFAEAGESSLVSLKVGGKTVPVIIYDVQKDPLTGEVVHVDLYQPSLNENIEVTVPIEFEGEAPAVRDTGGTLIKNLYEVQVEALPEKLPHEITVNVEVLKTLDDVITIKDLKVGEGVTVLGDPEESVAHVVPPENVEDELAKPIEEGVEDVERAGEQDGEEEEEGSEDK